MSRWHQGPPPRAWRGLTSLSGWQPSPPTIRGTRCVLQEPTGRLAERPKRPRGAQGCLHGRCTGRGAFAHLFSKAKWLQVLFFFLTIKTAKYVLLVRVWTTVKEDSFPIPPHGQRLPRVLMSLTPLLCVCMRPDKMVTVTSPAVPTPAPLLGNQSSGVDAVAPWGGGRTRAFCHPASATLSLLRCGRLALWPRGAS